MIGSKKVIALCLTRLKDRVQSSIAVALNEIAVNNGYKLMVFDSGVDFYYNNKYDIGAKSIYDIINYDYVDAVVLLATFFHSKQIKSDIIEKAKAAGKPVIVIDEVYEGCFSITKDFSDAFKALISHIVCEHEAHDTYFMAGNEQDDPISDARIACYREVLEKNGIEFSYDNVGYGGYWEVPTTAVMEKLIKRERMPQAIICANDAMAIAVCEFLAEHGYNVPHDIIVSGFDGIPDAEYYAPSISTCKEDIPRLAQTIVAIIEESRMSGRRSGNYHEYYAPFTAESCGCHVVASDERRKIIGNMFHVTQESGSHETYMYGWIEKMLESSSVDHLTNMISECIEKNSFVCLNSNFLATMMGNNGCEECRSRISQEVMVISHSRDENNLIQRQECFDVKQMVPDVEAWLSDDSMYVLSALYVGDTVCGYIASKTHNAFVDSHKNNRIVRSINIALSIVSKNFQRRRMEQDIKRAAMTNAVSGLPNIKGATAWFNEFQADDKNRQKAISVSIYSMPKYKYIYENYGIEDIEQTVVLVAQSLKIANPADCLVAHTAEGEFVVVNYYNNPNDISTVIHNATTLFFTSIEAYNNSSGKEYYVEVNAGCTVINPGWEGSLASFVKLASAEMYKNRLKMGQGAAVKEEKSDADNYQALSILLEKNLFRYHFQPIVSAKNGEIYAYEALMRTDESIGMSPLEVLETAGAYKRLYEIEKATMFNVLERFALDHDKFGGRNIFINSIPNYSLLEEDNKRLCERYQKYIDEIVLEITESNTISDEELQALKRIGNINFNNQIAIDDYGAGHSNIVNLLRYTPKIIKIDRYLISGIEKDKNKQMFVKSTVEFAKINGISVLAEGVETYDEMITVIDIGVDFIQGFYTGRPTYDPVTEIDAEIKSQIMAANPLLY